MPSQFPKYRAGSAELVNLPLTDKICELVPGFRFDHLNNRPVLGSTSAAAASSDPPVRTNVSDKDCPSLAQITESGRVITGVQEGNSELAAQLSNGNGHTIRDGTLSGRPRCLPASDVFHRRRLS